MPSSPTARTVARRARWSTPAGPWVKEVLNAISAQPTRDAVRLVKGSHIVLPRLYEGEHAFILQNDDRRVVFMIPYEERFTLVGTTDVDYDGDPRPRRASEAEVDYLCRALGRYLARAAARRRGRVALRRRAAALRRRLGGSFGDHARLHAAGRRRRGRGAGALGVRRQDHHLPAARRACAREARALLPGAQAGLDRAAPAAGQRLRRAARRQSASSSSAIRDCRRTCCRACSGATARCGRRCWATGASARTTARDLPSARSRLHGARMGALGRGRALAAHQVRPAHDRGATRARVAQVVGR